MDYCYIAIIDASKVRINTLITLIFRDYMILPILLHHYISSLSYLMIIMNFKQRINNNYLSVGLMGLVIKRY